MRNSSGEAFETMMNKTFNNILFSAKYLVICTLIILSSCVERGTGSRQGTVTESASTSADDDDDSKLDSPSFSGQYTNYIQNGNTKSSSTTTITQDFKDSFYVRGQHIHQYFQGHNDVDYVCLISNFENISETQKVLVLTANVESFINYTTHSREYYVSIEPNNKNLSETYCQATGLIDYINLTYPDAAEITYSFDSLCEDCHNVEMRSSGLLLLSSGGNELENVDLSYLTLNIDSINSFTQLASSCSSTSECKGLGYDCCSVGQCVKDLSLKNGVDKTKAPYIQSTFDIANNPSNIYNYPDLYNICASAVPETTTELNEINPYEEELARFTTLQELYECTTLVNGEMSICTVSYDNASHNLETFYTKEDDRNFTTTYTGEEGIPDHSIVKIVHAGLTLYEDGSALYQEYFGIGNTVGLILQGNDNLDDKVKISLEHTPDESAPDDVLTIKYKIDGSCYEINSKLARCKKYYIQGQDKGYTNDHFPASNTFKLPLYADTSRNIVVMQDSVQKYKNKDWDLVVGSPSAVKFSGTALQVIDTQEISVEFYVDLETNNVLNSKRIALDKIDEICQCGGPYCTLKEIFNNSTESEVIDYGCVYPEPETTPPPLEVSILMNSKSVPHRYFDEQGISHAEINIETPEQESSNSSGLPFAYTDNNLLKPNNLDDYIGFDEIYGTITYSTEMAKPPAEIDLVSGKTYDIFVNSGTYSSCFYCGNDYHSQVAKIFPKNLIHRGGGYRPHSSQTDRSSTENYRSDDLLFGRACFLPATMIAWAHRGDEDIVDQRKKRLSAQHLLFANGYQRDWYGFDYAAIIGSFDGVAWFAIGNQRRVKATSNKLFIAINAYFSDLTSQDSYNITVSDASLSLGAGSQTTDDNESDGAECRKYHECEVDSDCVAQLGWEYSCEFVTSFKTQWPKFDINAYELPGDETEGEEADKTIFDRILWGDISGKKCVYRGRGAPCLLNYTLEEGNDDSSFNGTDELGSLACAPNYYCQDISNAINTAKFNNRITRFGKSALMQNASEDVSDDYEHTFGLSTRVIGRPHDYNGEETVISTTALSNLKHNDVEGICLPGKNLTENTYVGQNSSAPSVFEGEKFNGDMVLGIGMTLSEESITNGSGDYDRANYFSSCGIFDYEGNYLYKNEDYANEQISTFDEIDGDNSEKHTIKYIAASQVTSTNVLKVFNDFQLGELELTRNFDEEQVESITLQENRCLRMPGSVCFSDLDCVASDYITNLTKDIDVENNQFNGVDGLNSYEIKFWQETLTCAQEYGPTHDDYALKNNRCCRATGEQMSIGQKIYDPDDNIGGYTEEFPKMTSGELLFIELTDRDDPKRYSRLSTYSITIKDEGYPNLQYPKEDACGSNCMPLEDSEERSDGITQINRQFRSFQTALSKMCCTQHWVRNFHEDNGEGHKFEFEKSQSISSENFICLNWKPDSTNAANVGDDGMTCEDQEDPEDHDCYSIDFGSGSQFTKAEERLRFLGSLELLGIPQVAISSSYVSDDNIDPTCLINIADQSDVSGVTNGATATMIPKTIDATQAKEITDDSGNQYFSAGDMANFITEDGVKQIFSPDTFSCCKKAGAELESGEDATEVCCTGFAYTSGSVQLCGLRSYTNLSVYTNLYVSSALKDVEIDDDQIDEKTGFVEPEYLKSLACNLQLCSSGAVATGVVVGALSIPGHEDNALRRTRFAISEDDDIYGAYFEVGLRWNTHVYCVPKSASSFVLIPEANYQECAF